jgi:hypothetical protein
VLRSISPKTQKNSRNYTKLVVNGEFESYFGEFFREPASIFFSWIIQISVCGWKVEKRKRQKLPNGLFPNFKNREKEREKNA